MNCTTSKVKLTCVVEAQKSWPPCRDPSVCCCTHPALYRGWQTPTKCQCRSKTKQELKLWIIFTVKMYTHLLAGFRLKLVFFPKLTYIRSLLKRLLRLLRKAASVVSSRRTKSWIPTRSLAVRAPSMSSWPCATSCIDLRAAAIHFSQSQNSSSGALELAHFYI